MKNWLCEMSLVTNEPDVPPLDNIQLSLARGNSPAQRCKTSLRQRYDDDPTPATVETIVADRLYTRVHWKGGNQGAGGLRRS